MSSSAATDPPFLWWGEGGGAVFSIISSFLSSATFLLAASASLFFLLPCSRVYTDELDWVNTESFLIGFLCFRGYNDANVVRYVGSTSEKTWPCEPNTFSLNPLQSWQDPETSKQKKRGRGWMCIGSRAYGHLWP